MDISVLLQYKSWDHKILLISKILSKIGPIYALFYTQLETLKNYLDKNLKKDFIWEVKIVAEFFILFILKKDEKLRLCVDYKKLNVITIKNKYLLSNIGKLQDRLIEVKWFTKLDFHETYNLIRIKEGNE